MSHLTASPEEFFEAVEYQQAKVDEGIIDISEKLSRVEIDNHQPGSQEHLDQDPSSLEPRAPRRPVKSGGYEAVELLRLLPSTFPQRGNAWDAMNFQIFDQERILPPTSDLVVIKNRVTAALLRSRMVPTVKWTLAFCRFPNANNPNSPYPNAQIGKINLSEEVIDANAEVKRYCFPKTLIIAGTRKVLEGAENRLNGIIMQAQQKHPASDLHNVIASVWDLTDATNLQTHRAQFQEGKRQIATCIPSHADNFICDDLKQVYILNLKERDKKRLKSLVGRLCSLKPQEKVKIMVMFDREDTHMMLWLKAVLEETGADMATPLGAVFEHLAMLGYPRW